MLQITVDQLARTLCASAILGAPIDTGDRVIIPIAEFGFAFGGGEGSGGDKMGHQGGGSGTGGGGGISAVALVVVTKGVTGPDGIQVISLKKKSQMAEVITTIGETVGPHISQVLEKGSEIVQKAPEMMQQKGKGSQGQKEGTEIPVSGEGEA
ncbi:hypothetical protein F8E02_03140 [Methanoculleus sp. Wushi-C6]|uniref:Sporulation protein n=2 Tax=Methanoculleus caldifontis TaxID=2651577 RepID=A0ABU3WYZ5_9EURY|nr:hypothetical protein [Methanoculleus sp. Wushi-C6]